jgi:hypothetical protein
MGTRDWYLMDYSNPYIPEARNTHTLLGVILLQRTSMLELLSHILFRNKTFYMLLVLNILSADPPYLAPVIGIFLLGGVVIECLPDPS